MKLTTKKKADGRYLVIRDGVETDIEISRGDPPKYRMPQEWDVSTVADGHYLFSGKGKERCLQILERLLAGVGVT